MVGAHPFSGMGMFGVSLDIIQAVASELEGRGWLASPVGGIPRGGHPGHSPGYDDDDVDVTQPWDWLGGIPRGGHPPWGASWT